MEHLNFADKILEALAGDDVQYVPSRDTLSMEMGMLTIGGGRVSVSQGRTASGNYIDQVCITTKIPGTINFDRVFWLDNLEVLGKYRRVLAEKYYAHAKGAAVAILDEMIKAEVERLQ